MHTHACALAQLILSSLSLTPRSERERKRNEPFVVVVVTDDERER